MLDIGQHIVQVADLQIRSNGVGTNHQCNIAIGKIRHQSTHNRDRCIQRVTHTKDDLIHRVVLMAERLVALIRSRIGSTQRN